MPLRKLDSRIKTVIENGVKTHHRSLFVMLGSRVRFSCYHMYNILSKAAAKAQPSVLYCVSKQLDLTKDQKARVEKDRVIGRCSFDASGDPFGYWISTADIRFCKYDESHKIMGRTFGMCVLQDFNGLTPNILARSIETVEGGGIILVLLRDAEMWEDVFHMSMDVHKRFRTHAWQDVVGRFNERFVLSLAQTPNVLFLDSHLEVLGVSSYAFNVTPVPPSISANSPSQEELRNLKLSLRDVQPAGKLISITTTLDQAQAVLTFLDAISDKALHTTVTLTAARGRGKSAALGLAITGAIVMGYSNVYVTAPSPDNLRTVFEFVIRGFDALGFHEHQDFNIIQSENVDLQKPVVRINIFRAHRQTIQYISPTDAHKLGQAELLVIDEAAAIPLPLVKALLGPYLVFLSSTINGYEGTGRSLSLKLIKQLRQQSAHAVAAQAASQSAEKVKNEMAVANRGYLPRMPKPLTEQQAPEEVPPEETDLSATTTESTSTSTSTSTSAQPLSAPSAAAAGNIQHMISGVALSSASSLNRILREVSLEEPIRYSVGDPIESWLNELLCLNASSKLQPLKYGAPHPSECQLFYVTRDSLFSYHKLSEDLLQQIMGLLVTSHYKNSPNDLQLLSDAPAHHLFALLGPVHDLQQLPDVLVVIQVALEGKISIDAVEKMAKSHLKGEFGDLIPWTLSQQFQDNEFPSLSGARVVRIAAHPDYNRMGYASYALQELLKYYQGDIALADELVADSVAPTTEAEKKYALKSELQPRKNLPPLLLQLSQRRAEALNYVGVAYGISPEVCNFWIKNGFSPVYLRQVSSDITGEFSCIMLRQLKNLLPPKVDWLSPYVVDFRTRFSFLLGYAFRTFSTSLALRLLVPDGKIICRSQITGKELKLLMSQHDIRRLKSYAKMLVDYHIVVDLMPRIGYLVFTHKVDLNFLPSQLALLCGMSLQHRTLESIAEELKLEVNQVMSMFNKIIRKCSAVLSQIYIDDAAREAIAEEKIATEAAQKAGVVNNPAIPRTLPAAVQKQDAELLGVEPPAEDTTTTTATGKRPRNDRESSTTATAASDKASVKELVSALNLTKYVLPKGVVDQVKAAVKESGGSVDEVVQQLDLPIPTVDVAPPKNKKSKAFRRW